jgi:hypothetical protein
LFWESKQINVDKLELIFALISDVFREFIKNSKKVTKRWIQWGAKIEIREKEKIIKQKKQSMMSIDEK